MEYSNFKNIRQVTKKFGLKARLTPLFEEKITLQPTKNPYKRAVCKGFLVKILRGPIS